MASPGYELRQEELWDVQVRHLAHLHISDLKQALIPPNLEATRRTFRFLYF